MVRVQSTRTDRYPTVESEATFSMRYRSATLPALLATLLTAPAEARAQACLGLPADMGQMALQAEVTTDPAGKRASYGGRLGVNFDTEYSLELAVRRPRSAAGRGTSVAALIGYESPTYEPVLCGTFGVRYHERPTESGVEKTTLLPIGMGIGKRLGSANSFSLALFVRPEYLYVLRPEPEGEYDTFWDELGHRSEGRGTVGILLGTPFIYASGAVEVATRDDLVPRLALGVGVLF